MIYRLHAHAAALNQKYKGDIEITTLLRDITCHMGSHSVTCHPAAVTFPPLLQPKLLLDLSTPEGCKAELIGVAAICYVLR